jgi:hypothetical protein
VAEVGVVEELELMRRPQSGCRREEEEDVKAEEEGPVIFILAMVRSSDSKADDMRAGTAVTATGQGGVSALGDAELQHGKRAKRE